MSGAVQGPVGPAPRNFLFPGLPKWALIGWWAQDDSFIGAPFYIGYGGTFPSPIPGLFIPDYRGPGGEGDYSPKARLVYFCNDDDYSDNAGWLHVFESYQA